MRTRLRKELFYDEEIGWAEIVVYPRWPDRVFLNAGYHLDLSKTSNMKKTLEVIGWVFEALSQTGLTEIYCTAKSQSSYDFNCMLGFVRTDEGSYEHQFEIMKKEL